MRLKTNILLISAKLMICLSLLFPKIGFAHIITITATSPFPSTIFTSATATATFRVTNVTSKVPITVIDQSRFPAGSGLSILSSTCGNLMGPGQSCMITLQLQTPAEPQTIHAELREWAKPSADGVRFPFTIAVVRPPQFIVTPSTGTGGSISPNTQQTVISGASLVFTATPNAGFAVNQWLLDGVLAQTGGLTYTLNNITANHTVEVTFFSGLIAVGNYRNTSAIQTPLIFLSTDNGTSWSPETTTLPVDFTKDGLLTNAACIGTTCFASGTYTQVITNINRPLIISSSNSGASWSSVPAPVPADFATSASFKAATCNSASTCVTVGIYFTGTIVKALILVSNDSGSSWSAIPPTLPANFKSSANLTSVICSGITCITAGNYTNLSDVELPLLLVSNNNGVSWTSVVSPLPPGYAGLGGINFLTRTGSNVVAVGTFLHSSFTARPLILISSDLGGTWTAVTPSLPSDFSSLGFLNAASCIGSICNAVGNYSDGSVTKPLLLHSTDTGASWSAITTTLPPNFSDFTSLRSIICTGLNCTAAGDYADASFIQFPMLLVSSDQGISWVSFALTLPSDFSDLGTINALTCSGSVCTAVGQYTNTSSIGLPLIYVSSNNGLTWSLVAPTLPANFSGVGVLNATVATL